MRRPELLSRLGVGSLLLAAIGLPLYLWGRSPIIHARMAETGGWSRDVLRAQVNVPLRLQFTSDDVTHGFAVGGMDMPSADILPGKVTDVTLLFDRPGTYTFYCTRWCGVNHWRMRGTIEVAGEGTAPQPPVPPLYVALGLDLDAARPAPTHLPASRPVSAIVSQQLVSTLSAYESQAYYRSHSPAEAWQGLRAAPMLAQLDDQDIWNLTASVWQSASTPAALTDGRRLFAQNCAACHGEGGAGNGVFAQQLSTAGVTSSEGTPTATMGIQTPANFTDPARMLSASPALLQGKILRGGMGTGMPSWGPIFTDRQTWELVAYLYTFQFTYR